MPPIQSEDHFSVKGIATFHFFSYRGSYYRISANEMSSEKISRAEFLEAVVNRFPQESDASIHEQLTDSGSRHAPEPLEKEHPVAGMDLFVAQTCNLSCVYCYGQDGTYGDRGLMSEKTALQAIDWLIEASGPVKSLRINFFGGEPLLNFSLIKTVVPYALARAEKAGKKALFQITTNGTLLDDEIIRFFQQHEFKVLVSIDGPQDIHDRQRRFADGNGSFKAVTQHLDNLVKNVPETDAHAVILGDTDPDIVINALRKFGFRGISVLPASGSVFITEEDPGKNRDTASILKHMEDEAELWLNLTKKRAIKQLQQLQTYSQFTAAVKSLLQHRKNYHPCGAAIGLVAVSCSGDIYPCHRFVGQEKHRIGDLSGHELNRNEYLKSPVMTNEHCMKCYARYYCAGGCKQDNIISGGSLYQPSEDMCRLRRRQFELAAYIVSELDKDGKLFLEQEGIIPPKPCPLDF